MQTDDSNMPVESGGGTPTASDQIPVVTQLLNYPTIFADAAWFASDFGGVVRIQFIENLLEPLGSESPGVKARHVGTLAMPRSGFKAMVQYLVGMDKWFDENLYAAKHGDS